MPRNHRYWEEPIPSHREQGYSRSYHNESSWRHYAPPTEVPPSSRFNYWRDEPTAPTSSYYPQRSHASRSHDEQWRDDSRASYAESSYSRRRRNFGAARDWDDHEPRRDRNLPPYRTPPRRHYSTYTPPPYISRPTLRAITPVESMSPLPKPVSPEPQRKVPPPPPPKTPQPLEPSTGYLALSQEPSKVLQDPRTSRKLLVLDLNGTLLIRSARSRSSSGTQLRAVQPRPYMQSLRQYLFCPETKAWLDTMVWSSAQPHSVDDMVEKVFGPAKNELKAVWNRKSLGLSEAEYHRKTVTTKDLAKPWSLLVSTLSPEKLERHPVVPSQSQAVHSAFTTLLLDDSPHKAALQPFNHVCIPEYDGTRRQHDLRSLLATKEPTEGKRNKKAKQKSREEIAAHSIDRIISGLPSGPITSESEEREPYDATLLAVIGILDAIKLQNNVAGWIRQGGLWATKERQEVGASDVNHGRVIDEDAKKASNSVVSAGNDANSASDPAMTSERAHLRTKMWFNDVSTVSYWVERGRRILMELGIQVGHGLTG